MNSVQLIGNLTRDPELRSTKSGTAVCGLRLAVNGRRKTSDGAWEEVPNYFDVSAFGRLAETCSEHLEKGRKVAITGRLEFREWTTDEDQKRSAVEVVAGTVDFLSSGGQIIGLPAAEDEEFEPALA